MVALNSTNTSPLPEDNQPLLPSYNNHSFPDEKDSSSPIDNVNNKTVVTTTTRGSKVKSAISNLTTFKKILLVLALGCASYNIMRFAAHGMHHGPPQHGSSPYGGRGRGGRGGPPGPPGGRNNFGGPDEGMMFEGDEMNFDGPPHGGRGRGGRGGRGGPPRGGPPGGPGRGQGKPSGWFGWLTGGGRGPQDGGDDSEFGPGQDGPRFEEIEEPVISQLTYTRSGEAFVLSAGDLNIISATAEPIEIDLASPFYDFEGVDRIVINHAANAGIIGTVQISKAVASDEDTIAEKRQIKEIAEGVEKIWEFVESDGEEMDSTTDTEVEDAGRPERGGKHMPPPPPPFEHGDKFPKHRGPPGRGPRGGKDKRPTRPTNAEKTIIKVHTSLSQSQIDSNDLTLAKSLAAPSVEVSKTSRSIELTFAAPDAEVASYAALEPRYHVEIIIPASADENMIPGLTINGEDVVFVVAESAAGVHIRQLNVDARTMNTCIGNDCAGSLNVGEGQIELSTGDLAGDYEVLKELVLKTTTGNVNANIVILPLGPPPHHNGTFPPHHNGTHHGPPPHKGGKPKGPPPRGPPPKDGKHPKGPKHEEKKRYMDDEEMELDTEAFTDSDEMDEFPAGESEFPELEELMEGEQDFKGEHKGPKHGKGPKGDKHGKGPKGGKGPTHGPPHGPPGPPHGRPGPPRGPPGPHGPPPATVKAFSVTGSITLNYISQPANRSLISEAISETGTVSVKLAPEYKGKFIAGAKVGSVTFANETDAVVNIIKEDKTATGAFLEGFTHPASFNGSLPAHPPRHGFENDENEADLPPFGGDRSDRGSEFGRRGRGPREGRVEKRSSDDEKKGKHGRHGGDRKKGPGGPPPHFPGEKGPGGPPPPPHGDHKGPGGPPPPPPHGDHRGPGGPPPPHGHKGPGGPPPHGGPKGPGGPPPPPPGFSFSAAFTKVGSVALTV